MVVTLAMSLFDLQDVCIAIGSLATLDLPMVVDLIGIYVLKGPYCTLTTTNWFLQALSVIPRGSWVDVARRFTMIRWARVDVNAGQISCSSKRKRRRFVVATGSPTASCDWNLAESKFSSLSFLILRTLEHCSAVSFFGDFPSFPVVVLLVRVAHYHTVDTPRGHCMLLIILGAMFEFLSSFESRAFRCYSASHA
ncbi:acyl-CoA dehydrogenase family member 10 [Dorcoceras hygrometricum]|uniref:Acyl-CoA dehydrogenase family member 10 n=1 Tax=Dorcoceras hygrometricum TaxID=472368 RepID=A0A2Z7A9J8_9LAMI|nr:acyl-CoA dehydrogenase family member 10 [Dorcoceras hygrometricum]